MAQVSNNLKRLRKKIKLFDQEALNWVLFDVIDEVCEIYSSHVIDDEHKQEIIERLKKIYRATEAELTPPDPKQQKLF